MNEKGLDMKGKKLTYVCIKQNGTFECLKCKREIGSGEDHMTGLLDCSQRPMNGETDRVYVYKLCNECFKEVKDDEKWLLILEDDIELALKTQPRYKFGEGLSQQEKDRLARWILLGKE